jgi:hypothetical protein
MNVGVEGVTKLMTMLDVDVVGHRRVAPVLST